MKPRSNVMLLAIVGALTLLLVGAVIVAASNDAAPPQQGGLVISIGKVVNPTDVTAGDTVSYTVTLHNTSQQLVPSVVVTDALPSLVTYEQGSLSASSGNAVADGNYITWTGNVVPNGDVVIRFRAIIVPQVTCQTIIINHAYVRVGVAIGQSPPAAIQVICPDLGDAPDNTNHFGASMTAYPPGGPLGVAARFPTVFGGPPGSVRGPYHRFSRTDSWLGANVSAEADADLFWDNDGFRNLEPPFDVSDHDGMDDGYLGGTFVNCQPSTFSYRVTIVGPATQRYFNAWFDFNKDGDWEDVIQCPDGTLVYEWAVQNQPIGFGPGSYTITTPSFTPYLPAAANLMWMRMTLTRQEQPPVNPSTSRPDGRGPDPGYVYGETEDYYFVHEQQGHPDLHAVKTVNPTMATPGSTLTYTIVISNNGSGPATGVQFQDNIPPGTTYVSGSATASSGTVSFGGTSVNWIGNIPPSGSVTITFQVTVNSTFQCPGLVQNAGMVMFNGQALATNTANTEIVCPSPVIIEKMVSPTSASLGDTLWYTITLSNPTATPIIGATAEDQIPAGTSYVSGSAWASSGTAGWVFNKVVWSGNIPPFGSVTFGFRVVVGSTATPQECSGRVDNKAQFFLNGAVFNSNLVSTQIMCPDLGDAPDSTNHFSLNMQAYGSGVQGRFPTVFDAATGLPQGPLHRLPRADAWLGPWVSAERDADQMPDEDARPNLDPIMNAADQDRFDDGVKLPVSLLDCQSNTLDFTVSAQPGATRNRVVNVWFDFNQDGDWEDTIQCANGLVAQEWAVQNQVVAVPGSGSFGSTLFTSNPYIAWTPVANSPVWMRITLSDVNAPPAGSGNPDGRGPASGYRMGETEDYLLPGRPGDPPHLTIDKTSDVQHGWIGDTITYSITVKNLSNTPATGLTVTDPIPAGTTYVSGSVGATLPTATFTGTAIQWTGNLPPMGQVIIWFKVTVVGNPTTPPECNQKIINRATLTSPDGVTLTSNPVNFYLVCPDLGDAPDNTNHFGAAMTAYPAVAARYPTVFDPATGAVQGPRHLQPKADAFLGYGVTGERDADLMPDQDGVPNIDPPANVPNHDGMDDGLMRPLNLPNCQPTSITYVVTVVGPARTRYVNAWFDWNRDGDWEDTFQCPGLPIAPDEWAVKNQVINFGPGVYTVTSPIFLPFNPNPNQSMWLRLTLSEAMAPVNPGTLRPDGRGPASAYRFGETEDYFNGDGVGNPDVWIHKTFQRFEPDEGTAIPGQQGSGWRALWHIDYGNSGTATASNVGVTDVFPSGMSYASSTSNPNHEPPAVGGSSATWSIGTLSPGDNGFIDLWLYAPATSLPSGTVVTNTATISTTTPGDDPSNNTSSASGIVPLMPPRITWPLAGTTCSGSITVAGTSALGTVVDVYVDNSLAGTATTNGNGDWSLPVTGLSNGPHSIYAIARIGANSSPPSPTVVVIVNTSLTWDPLSLTFTAYYGNVPYVQHIVNGSGRADPTGWTVRMRAPFTYTVDVHVCCTLPASAQVTITMGVTPYVMTHIGGGWYQTVLPGVTGGNTALSIQCSCDGNTTGGDGTGLIDPDGYVFDVDTGVDKTDPIFNLMGRTVTALEEVAMNTWIRWPAEYYEAQINPQITGADGYYSFFTPPGNYRITVAGDAQYQPYRSWTITVVDTPQHLDVPLTKVYNSTQAGVNVDASGFQPAMIQVWQGATVAWKNTELADGSFHSATSDLDARAHTVGFDSGLLDRGQTYRRKFNTIGVFPYHDVENTGATGVVQVCKRTDVNCSNTVDVLDIAATAARWNGVYDSRYDINDDGFITIVDIQKVAADFGWSN